ncbi:MAG: nucleotidyltransferase family protein [Pseudoxanthomonas sp.]
MKPGHVAVVLAAGASERLGEPKQLLKRNGETLVHRAVRLAEATGPSELVLVCGAYRTEVQQAAGGTGITVLFNPQWQQGLATSLQIAAQHLQGGEQDCLLLGCDQPALELFHLQALLESAFSAASGCAASLHADRPGIPAVVAASTLSQARHLQGNRGLRDVLRKLPAGSLGLLHADALAFDIDTPADKEKAVIDGLLDR